MTTVTVVRVYFTEGKRQLEPIMRYLHDEASLQGVTVFRAISGFGGSGVMHLASIVDMSLDLPLVIEFFDDPKKIETILLELKTSIKPGHIISWQAEMQ